MLRLCLTFALLLATLHTASAEKLDPRQIAIIRETALSICSSVKDAKGEKTDVQIQGDVRGQLSGLVGRLAAVGGSGTGSLTRTEFEGLTQEATGIALVGDRECRERLFNTMFGKLGSATPPRSQATTQLDCSPLEPNRPRNLNSEATGRIDAKLQRFVDISGNIDGSYSQASQDVLKEYPNADRLYLFERLIYLSCEVLSSANMPDTEKFDRLEQLEERLDRPPPAKTDEPDRHGRSGAPDAEKTSVVELLLDANTLVGEKKYKAALPKLEQAARLGSVDAQVALGVLYTSGFEGIPWDPDQAFRLFKIAADQGNASAIGRLGVSYFKGEGVGQNIPEALRYVTMGAERGDPLSLDTMGHFAENGVGNLAPDACKALRYYDQSAKLGSAAGQFSLASMYLKGSCVAKDVKRARRLMEKSAAAGNPYAVAGLKLMHDQGLDAE